MTDTSPCPFCNLLRTDSFQTFGSVAYFKDRYPVTEGHTIIIPLRHCETYFDLTPEEVTDIHAVLHQLRAEFNREGVEAFNIGWNAGATAGQTVPHAHCHLIPRRPGDMEDPRGGVRGVIPSKQRY